MQKNYFNALAASLGSGLEYFAFISFALQAQYIGALFFPQDARIQGVLNTFLIFATGSFVTVIGGCIFGALGDRFGRKSTFIYAILLMSLASLGIGILPTHWGWVSLALLIVFRILQGISQGAELPGAITFIVEHAEDHNKGWLCGLMFLGVGLGAGLATSINVMLTHFLSFEEMLAYGWRIPFLAATLLGLLGIILRRKVTETPVFLRTHQKTSAVAPYQQKGSFYTIHLLLGFGLVFLGATLVSLGLYWPAFLSNYYHFDMEQVFFAIMLAFILTAFLLPVFGALGDRYGRGKIYLMGVVLVIVFMPLLFEVLAKGQLIIFSLIYYLLIVILAANYPVMLTELFPPEHRFLSVALSYAGCYALTSFAPALAAFLLLRQGSDQGLLILIESAAVIGLLAGLGYVRIQRKY
ncbi:MAG: MFS transporter [Gammaproteobacteria bacterium]|nr:MFS transporter [Gammaproteobacteria bacterium]